MATLVEIHAGDAGLSPPCVEMDTPALGVWGYAPQSLDIIALDSAMMDNRVVIVVDVLVLCQIEENAG